MNAVETYVSSLDYRWLAACAAMLMLLAAAGMLAFRRTRWLSHLRQKSLLTANEAEFFHRLNRALPGYHVFPQVSFGAFVTDDGRLSAQARWSVRARFERKIADFVICDPKSLAIVALIELDDRTHNARADRERDAITKAAGYQTFRFQSRQKPSETDIAALFQHARAWARS